MALEVQQTIGSKATWTIGTNIAHSAGNTLPEQPLLVGYPRGLSWAPYYSYCNDLGPIFRNFTTILFADDSNLIVKGNSLNLIEQKINQDTPALTKWLETNRLSLNLKKNHVMVFGKKRKNYDNLLNISIQGTKLDIVTHTKFLGIVLYNSLTWKQHIIYLTKKVAKSIGIISQARKFLNVDSLRQLYFVFLFPYLSYANIFWGNAADSHLWPIFKLQKRAIRSILNIRRRDSTKFGFQKLKILRLPDIYKYSVLIFLYQFKNNLLPPTFKNFYSENREFHSHLTRSANVLRPP
jgi:hypothetical protein